ncbi:MAG: radical SAM protein [Nanoarchaeota archaeon]
MTHDYANILFTGPCNLRCYECIGEHPALRGLPSNHDSFPPKNIDALIERVNAERIPDLAFTGTDMDPQLYRHEERLIHYVRERITGQTKLSLHTNGQLALRRIDVFNQYDKASISLHSYDPATYHAITQGRHPPDIEAILSRATIPIKLSLLITPHNIHEIEDYLARSARIGITRVVVRKLKGREDEFPIERKTPFAEKQPIKRVFGWPVYAIHGMEVTICGFDQSTARGLYLFSDGRMEDRLV